MASHIKGIVLKSRLDYVKKAYGEEAYARLIESLSPEARAAVGGDILISSWYPLPQVLELLISLDRMFGKGDLLLCREIARYTARVALQGGVQQSFAKEHDPDFVIKMGPILWKQYYDSGEMESEAAGRDGAIVRVKGFEEPHRALCLGVVGWLEAAIEIWGGGEIEVVETKCRVMGYDCCEFTMKWKDLREAQDSA